MREVDEAVRQDQALDALRRWGKPLAAAIIAGLLGFAGYLWWDHHNQAALATESEQLSLALDAMEAGNLPAGDKALAPIANDAKGGSAVAARLLQAGIAAEQGKGDAAATQFQTVADDAKAPQPLRDMARIRAVALRFDTMPPADGVVAMKPLAVPGKPWFGSAGELLGLAYMKQNRNDLAGPLFAAISRDKGVPESLRARARQMAGLLGVDAIDDVNDAVSAQSSAVQPPAGAAQ